MSAGVHVRRGDEARARGLGDYMTDARAATVVDVNPLAGLSLLLLVAVLLSAGLWANGAVLDEVTRGQGTVIPSSREQVIQSLEGGILAELHVREGDVVEKGEVLLRIDDTRFESSLREGVARAQALRAAVARLRAEAEGTPLEFPEGLPPDVVANETELYRSRRRALSESIAAVSRSLRLAEEELEMTAPLVDEGAVSEVEILRLRREVNELRGTIRDRRNAFRSEARAELADKEAELARVREINEGRADQVRRTVIRAPMRGTVKNVEVNTLGGVIRPGDDIMEIVPLEDRLLVEARIRPADVAFLRPGLPATVKITAYDYSVYGSLDGVLTHISADTIRDERRSEEEQEGFYRVLVRTEDSHLEGEDGPLPIIPGMTATVEVLTGHKTVLEYILAPLLEIRDEALRER